MRQSGREREREKDREKVRETRKKREADKQERFSINLGLRLPVTLMTHCVFSKVHILCKSVMTASPLKL